jgi:NAD(P)H dehydrogenase (quinone)
MLLVTGATGYVGGAALRLLAALSGSRSIVGVARNVDRAALTVPKGVAFTIADYDDRPSLDKAFAGATSLLFVASDGAGPDVVRQHANVIDAAAASGIAHIVFMSIVDVDETSPFYFAAVYRDAERRLLECGTAWTILRCGLYSDFLFSHWLEPARSTGVIAVPAGRARIAPLSRDDVAAAAVAVLVSGAHRGQVYELTGPRTYSFDEIGELAGRSFGVPIAYRPCSPTDYLLRCWATMQDPWPHAFSTMFASVAQGRYASISSAVQDLTGRAPEDLEAFLARKAYAESEPKA